MLDPTTDDSFRSFLPGQREDESGVIPRFFMKEVLLGAKSQELGREVYEDREHIEIKIKGQDKGIYCDLVRDAHRKRFPIAYAAFKAGKEAPVVGTPVEQMSGIGPAMAHNLRGLNIRTIEDLASISDENALSAIGMGARDLVNRAKAWVQGKAPEVTALQDQLAAERQARQELEARLAALEASKRKPGRPKREEAA